MVALLSCGGDRWTVPPYQPIDLAPERLAVAAAEPAVAPSAPAASPRPGRTLPVGVESGIDAAVAAALAAGKLPGAVVLVGRHDGVFFERAYGSRSVQPIRTPMTVDTVFDLASLTKPVATASSVLVLVDRGQVELEAPLRTYLPELGDRGAGTVRQALSHTAGFLSDTPIADFDSGIEEAVRRIARAPLRSAPGAETRYSDLGFILLAEVVRRVSGRDVATFAHDEVFARLGMSDTGFLPNAPLRARAAPTEQVDGRWLLGEVHDPRARALGGIAGHAGLFSTAEDLARFAQSILGGGPAFLSPSALQKYTAPNDIPHAVRALGWDVRSAFSSNRGAALSPRAFGHGGYTGTSLWIDPTKDLFVVFLSNRVHPDGKGAINPLAGAIADLAASAFEPEERVLPACGDPVGPIDNGVDVLSREGFGRLAGAHVGLVTNASGRSREGERDVDVLARAPGLTLMAIFAPEHGLSTDQDAIVADGRDAATGLPVYSLYGEHFTPTDAELAGIDTLVFDLPDVGTRFFTYASTMHRALAAAAARGLRFVVLDRPDPLDGIHVEGPVLPKDRHSFVNHAPLPIRPGLTMGELALLLDANDHLGAKLDVVRASGWTRERLFADTGLPWRVPSPNLKTPTEALLYPGLGLLEATNVSVGRGTSEPFEVIGAPWIDGPKLAAALAEASVEGVRVQPTRFTPTSSTHRGEVCQGVKFTVVRPEVFAPVRLGIALAVALHRLYPAAWDERGLAKLLVSPAASEAIDRGASSAEVVATWSDELSTFKAERTKYLLYPTRPCVAPR